VALDNLDWECWECKIKVAEALPAKVLFKALWKKLRKS
jgi:hypothetical protein